MSSSRRRSSALATGPGLPSPISLLVPLDDRRHFHRAAEEQHLAGRARVGHRDVADLDALEKSLIPQRAGELQEPERRAAGEDVVELRVGEHAVAGHEGHVHVGAFADVTVRIDEHAVVESCLLGLHLHQDIRQVVGGLS